MDRFQNMKKSPIIPRLIATALCFILPSLSAQAQSNVVFTSNDVSIDQIGTTNLALISTSALNNITALQNGQNNQAAITITGTSNGDLAEPIRVDQTGENNSLTATITGDENRLTTSQNSSGAINNAVINQNGQFNAVSLEQDAAGLVDGLANQAQITQTGQNNSATVQQTAFVAGTSLFNNDVLIDQTGDDNIANSTQSGVNNKSEQTQVGDRNRSDILQTGNDNIAIHRQFGNDLSVPANLGGLVIEQTGGATVTVEQYAPGTAPLPGP